MTRALILIGFGLILFLLGFFLFQNSSQISSDTTNTTTPKTGNIVITTNAVMPSQQSRRALELQEIQNPPVVSVSALEASCSSEETAPDVIEGIVLIGSKAAAGGWIRPLAHQLLGIDCDTHLNPSNLVEGLLLHYPIDTDGKFQITGLKEGFYCLEVNVPPISPRVFKFYISPLQKNQRKIVALGEGRIQGTIYDAGGVPVPKVIMRASLSSALGDELSLRTETDAQGQYLIENLPATQIYLYRLHEEDALTSDFRMLDLGEREVKVVDFGSASKLATISGRLLDRAGNPAKTSARVSFRSYDQKTVGAETEVDRTFRTVSTDQEGRYSIFLPAGIYLSSIDNCLGASNSEIKIEVSTSDLTLDFTLQGTRIWGSIIHRKNSTVEVICLLDKNSSEMQCAEIEENLFFNFLGVAPGQYKLFVKPLWSEANQDPQIIGELDLEIRESDIEIQTELVVD